jgi:hypothetical protein
MLLAHLYFLCLLRSRLFFGFVLGVRPGWSSVCFEMNDGLWDELVSIAFVNGNLTVGIDLTFEVVENTWVCSDGLKIRVVLLTSKEVIGLKLFEGMEPCL